MEQKGMHLMSPGEIQQTIDMFTTNLKDMTLRAKIVFHGEIALQLAILNKNIEEANALQRRLQIKVEEDQQVTGG